LTASCPPRDIDPAWCAIADTDVEPTIAVEISHLASVVRERPHRHFHRRPERGFAWSPNARADRRAREQHQRARAGSVVRCCQQRHILQSVAVEVASATARDAADGVDLERLAPQRQQRPRLTEHQVVHRTAERHAGVGDEYIGHAIAIEVADTQVAGIAFLQHFRIADPLQRTKALEHAVLLRQQQVQVGNPALLDEQHEVVRRAWPQVIKTDCGSGDRRLGQQRTARPEEGVRIGVEEAAARDHFSFDVT
jgi:hypothetical protein